MTLREAFGHPRRRALLALNVAGGVLVLGSYVWGIGAHPETAGSAWGGVPEALRPLYVGSMLLAALGYFPLTHHFLLRLDPETARLGGMGYSTVIGLYALVLIPSALWMPMTYRMIAHPDPALWVAIRVVLLAVAIGSVGLLWVLFRTTPDHRVAARLAMAGAVAFCFQTAVLDAFIWPAYFPR